MFDIHIDDEQLDVYSLKISDLIIRAAVEIESITKELYTSNGGVKTKHFKFDDDGLKYLNQLWNIEKKAVIISSPQCYLTKRILFPFMRGVNRKSNQKLTYRWNDSYQNIKHDRAKSLKYGSIRNLLNIMASLYVLNIYLRNETIHIGANPFYYKHLNSLGSEVFAVNFHVGVGEPDRYLKSDDYDESVYLIKLTESSKNKIVAARQKGSSISNELLHQHPKYIKFISENEIIDNSWNDMMMIQVLGWDEWGYIKSEAFKHEMEAISNNQYEAIPNENNM